MNIRDYALGHARNETNYYFVATIQYQNKCQLRLCGVRIVTSFGLKFRRNDALQVLYRMYVEEQHCFDHQSLKIYRCCALRKSVHQFKCSRVQFQFSFCTLSVSTDVCWDLFHIMLRYCVS